MTRVKNKKAQATLLPYLPQLPERDPALVRRVMKQVVARQHKIDQLQREIGSLARELVGREVDFQRSGWLQEGIILECSSHTGGRLRILNLDTGAIDWLSFDVVWTCYDPTYPCPPRRRKEFEDKETVG